MKILYATVAAGGEDVVPQQLARVDPSVEITTVIGTTEALGELRHKVSYHALMTSPALPRNEVLALIATLRRDRVPVAIAPIVTESDQDFLAPAIAAGADDVLLIRGQALVHAAETLARVRQSPHLRPADERRRLHVAYCGDDPQVWELLEMAPFVKAEQVKCAPDGSCPALGAVPGERTTPCDVVVIDERPGEAHPLQVVKTIKAQASDMPVIVLTSSSAGDIGTAALDLGADDTVIKSGIYRRRLVASLHRLHQRLEITAQHAAMRLREARMRQIVETLPEGVTSIDGTGVILAMNGAGLALVGAGRPRDVVGRPFITLVVPEQRDEVAALLERICGGDRGEVQFDVDTTEGRRRLELRGVMLERDARGGRGVVAVLRPAIPAVDGAEVERFDAELRQAREALKAAEERRRQNDEAVRAERQARQTADADVERLGRELAAAAAQRAELESSLETARHDAEDALASFDEERAAWERARHDLEAQRAALEAARQTEKEQFDKQAGSIERRLREAAVAGARVEVEAIREAARADIDRMSGTLADERHRFANERDRFRAEAEAWTEERRSLTEALDQARSAAAEARTAATSAGLGAEEEIDRLRAALDEARSLARAAETRATSLEQTVEALRKEGLAQASAIERLTSDRDFLTGHRDDLQRRLEEQRAVAEEQTALEAALEATRLELNQALATLRLVESERVSALEELEATNGGHELLSSERDMLQSEVERLNDELARFRTEGDGTLAEIERLRPEHEQLRAEYERLVGEHDQLRVEHDRAIRERDAEQDSSRRLNEATEALEGTRGELASAASAHEAERAAWNDTRRDLEARLHDLEARLADADAALQAQHEAQASIEAERTHVEADRARLEEAVRAHDAERIAWEDARRNLEARLTDAETALQGQADVHTALEETRRRLDEAQRAHEDERTAWHDLQLRLEGELADASQAASALEEARRTVESLRDELRRVGEAQIAEREAWHAERAQQDEQQGAAEAAWTAERERLEHAQRDLATHLREAERRAGEAAVIEERLRRSQIEAERRIASVQSEERLARLALEARLGEASDRIVRLTEEAGNLRSGLTSALASAEADRDRLLDSGIFGQAIMTLEGRLVRCNDAFARILGYRNADDACSRAGDRPLAPLAGREQLDARLLAEGSLSRAEAWLTRVDGQTIRVIESATIVPGQSGTPPLIERILIDVTAQSALEMRLRQATRLEEAGRLAAAMAPEIETLLTSIADDVAAGREGEMTDALRAGAIRESAARAGELVRQLLAFSRRQMRPTELVHLNDLVQRAEPLLARLAGPYIGFQVDTEPLPPIVANEDDVDELLTGLVVAARDLLPVGGSIRVETGVLDPADRHAADEMADPVVRLTVTASGYGVQAAQHTWALELAAQRCGGALHPGGDPDHTSCLAVYLPGSHAESPTSGTRAETRRLVIED